VRILSRVSGLASRVFWFVYIAHLYAVAVLTRTAVRLSLEGETYVATGDDGRGHTIGVLVFDGVNGNPETVRNSIHRAALFKESYDSQAAWSL